MTWMRSDTVTDPAARSTETNEHLRVIGDRAVEASRELGRLVLCTYEKRVAGLVELENRAAGAIDDDLLKAVVAAHARFVTDVNGAYVKAVRDALPG
jgi:hypothetical protein